MKIVRIEHLLASTAFGLALALFSHTGMAQQTGQQTEAVAPATDSMTASDAVKDTAGSKTEDTTEAKPDDSAADAAKEASTDESTQDATAAADAEKDKALAAPAPARSAVAEQLHELITGKQLDRYVKRQEDRAAVDAFYSLRDYTPLWLKDGAASDLAKAAAAYLEKVDTVGLDPRDYPTPEFAAAATPEEQAEAELRMTNTVLTYARHAEIGRVHFSRVASDIAFELEPPQPAKVLAKVSYSDDVAKALDSYNPPQESFKALKAKLAELRANDGKIEKAEDTSEQVRVPGGRILRPGMKDKRVLALRQRLKVPGDKNSTLYDDEVVDAVKAFQTGADIGVDGMLGPQTVRTLNGEGVLHHEPANPIDTIMVNMERWRWLPRKLGNDEDTYVVVNVPDYSLSLFHRGQRIWKTKIVVGKPSNMTPMTSASMKYITVNPTWNVPPSIIENEYLPALAQDPTVLDRYGLKIYQTRDGAVHIYQPPGAGNALGRIRFNFPNRFLVYQHDTPEKYLFKRDKRAYSHGCMRVQDPLEYGVKLLGIELPEENYTKAKLQNMFGDNEINIDLPKPIPVHLTYQTAFVEDGELQFREDVYGRDRRMIQILKGSERKVADTAVVHPPDASAVPVRLPVGTYGSYGDENSYGSYNNGPNFFDWLFGGPPRQRYRPRGFIGPNHDNNGRYTRR